MGIERPLIGDSWGIFNNSGLIKILHFNIGFLRPLACDLWLLARLLGYGFLSFLFIRIVFHLIDCFVNSFYLLSSLLHGVDSLFYPLRVLKLLDVHLDALLCLCLLLFDIFLHFFFGLLGHFSLDFLGDNFLFQIYDILF